LERIDKDRVLRLWSVILYTQGKSKYKKDFPEIHFFKSNKKNTNYGEYYNNGNIIKIWWKDHGGIVELAKTMVHEYAHYLQFWPWYNRYNAIYGYENNPYEVQARDLEKIAPSLVELTRIDNWCELLIKDKKLKRLYKKVKNTVTVEI
jgi:hypothetical protein